MLSFLEELNLIDAGSGDMPSYPTIDEVACSATQLIEIEKTKRSALQITANTGDLANIIQLAAEAHITCALADTKKKVNSMNVIAVIRKIAEIRLLQSQIKNDTELALTSWMLSNLKIQRAITGPSILVVN